jgi:hypothetical protein
MWIISKTLAAAFFALVVPATMFAHSDGIYNPTANNVGSFEGIDSNQAIAASYHGPGDIASYNVFYGLRAYSKATLGNAIANLCNSTGGADVTCADATSNPTTGALVIPSSLTTFCPGSVCTVKTLYDQTGGNACSGSTTCNVTQATVSKRPIIATSAVIGGQQVMQFNNSVQMVLNSATAAPSLAQPFTLTSVAERTGNFSSNGGLFEDTAQTGLIWNSSVNSISIYAGGASQMPATAADSSPHSFQALMNGNTSSTINVDGTVTGVGGSSPGTAGWGSVAIAIGQSSGNYATMYFAEAGAVAGAQSTTVQGSICHNQIIFYGISGSC